MASNLSKSAAVVTALLMAASLGACSDLGQDAKNIGDYLNLRNSLLDPSQVGRFDKENPWGTSKPVTWPILQQLEVVDEPNEHWTTATDPLPSDLVVERREYIVGEGDTLNISVFALVTPDIPYQEQRVVDELGNVRLQNVGTVHVDGMTPSQIEEQIAQIAVDKGFLLPKGNGSPGPQVSVQLYQSRAKIFSVLGQVQGAGTYNIIGTDFRLLDALALAHDINGGTRPGLDYLYVIRSQKDAGVIPPTAASKPSDTQPATAPGALDTLDKLKQGSSAAPARPTPSVADGPVLIRELPKSMLTLAEAASTQNALDAAISGAAPTPPATPAASAAAPTPATPAASAAAPAATASGEALMNQAVGGPATKPGMIYVDGKWVEVPSASLGNMSPAEAAAAASGLTATRVIRIPLNKLLEGDSRYNIVIRPGDTIRVPNIEPGEFYLMGHVGRPGVYDMTGRKVTLKQAVAAAGGLDALAIPRRCDLIRRIGNTEITVQIDLQRIFDGEQPDIFLKPNDMVNVGTDAIAPFLAVTRNAYRASYGWGFTYDRNLYNQPVITQSSK